LSRRPVHALALLGVLALAACGGDPVQRLEARRARYDATLQSFVLRDAAGGGQEVLLDVLVRHAGGEPLPGITLDVSMVDARRQEKARRRLWIDLPPAVGTGGTQLSLVLTDVDYQPGDGFWVEVRSPVPAAERGEYRELGELGELAPAP
jgi:hypothetical protein